MLSMISLTIVSFVFTIILMSPCCGKFKNNSCASNNLIGSDQFLLTLEFEDRSEKQDTNIFFLFKCIVLVAKRMYQYHRKSQQKLGVPLYLGSVD